MDGNGHTISQIHTTNFNTAFGNGLFGYLKDTHIRNLKLDDVRINTILPTNIGGKVGNLVGSLAGVASNTTITNVSASRVEIAAGDTNDVTGGLIGYLGADSLITDSSVSADSILGGASTGGLVGTAISSSISSSSVTANSIINIATGAVNDGTGGAVGHYLFAGVDLNSVSVEVGSISSSGDNVGGLLGSQALLQGGAADTITSSFARVGSISGLNNVGGLAGALPAIGVPPITPQRRITSSVAEIGDISGTSNVGGLVGSSRYDINSSMVIVGNLTSSTSTGVTGGLVGDVLAAFAFAPAPAPSIDNSLALVNLLNGMNVGELIGAGSALATTTNNYHSVTHFPFTASADTTRAKTHLELQTGAIPASASDMTYTGWGDAWCSPATGEFVSQAASPGSDYVRVWSAGTSSDFPSIACFGEAYNATAQNAAVERVVINNQFANHDGDAFPDAFDLCPRTFSTLNSDADGDTIGDACDDTLGGAAGRLTGFSFGAVDPVAPTFLRINANVPQLQPGFVRLRLKSVPVITFYRLTDDSTDSSRKRTGYSRQEITHPPITLNIASLAEKGKYEAVYAPSYRFDRGDGTFQDSMGETVVTSNIFTTVH